jgi:hypothetical protein
VISTRSHQHFNGRRLSKEGEPRAGTGHDAERTPLRDQSRARRIGADDLRAAGVLSAFTFLSLRHCNVTNAVLWELCGLSELSTLYLHDCTHVTDVGVRKLRDLTALRTLVHNGCTHVTDVGLQHLMSLTALSDLWLYGTSNPPVVHVQLGGWDLFVISTVRARVATFPSTMAPYMKYCMKRSS